MHRKRGQSNKGQRPCQLHVAEPGLELVLFLSIYVLKLILLSIADLQCCVHFRCIVKWINYTLHISSFLEVLSLYRSLQSTFFFNWSIVDWFTVLCQSLLYSKVTPLYMRIHYFHIHFHYSLSRSMEYSSLCYTKAPCCLSVQNAMVCIDRHWPSPAPRPHPPGLATTSLSCVSVSLSPFFRWEHLCRISDCTYKRYRTVSISLWPTSQHGYL